MVNVSANILALAAVRLVVAREVSPFFYGNKSFQMETQVFLAGYFHFLPHGVVKRKKSLKTTCPGGISRFHSSFHRQTKALNLGSLS